MKENIHWETVQGFGEEWQHFDQSQLSHEEHEKLFEAYFSLFPWSQLPKDAVGFDMGCGSGRWAQAVAPRVGHLHCVDPSKAIEIARKNLSNRANCSFHHAGVDTVPFHKESMDFGYSLGVLHHIPDTASALKVCTEKLKPGAPFLLYLYYAFDHRPLWFRGLWKLSDLLRRGICRLPFSLRSFFSQGLAALIYFPVARLALLFEKLGLSVEHFPLAAYKDRSFYTMRTDALDRFGTPLEQRFTQKQIQIMMEEAGLENIVFSPKIPFWCALGYKKQTS